MTTVIPVIILTPNWVQYRAYSATVISTVAVPYAKAKSVWNVLVILVFYTSPHFLASSLN
jgi:hypothetical protein